MIVTNDLSCTTSSTAESNHMFTDVYDVPQANMIATGGVCQGDEICLTYSGETAGVVSIEWDILDGMESHYYGPGPHCFMPVTNHIQVAVYSFDVNGCHDSVVITSYSIHYTKLYDDQTGTYCQWATVHYTANPVNCGSNPVYQWYHNGVPVGTDSDIV